MRRKEKGCAEKEKKVTLHRPPELEAVRAFFLSEDRQEVEAIRFFHHYSANGWMLGRTPMQDWQAGARKWMLNGLSQSREGDERSQGNREAELAGERDYSEPL